MLFKRNLRHQERLKKTRIGNDNGRHTRHKKANTATLMTVAFKTRTTKRNNGSYYIMSKASTYEEDE